MIPAFEFGTCSSDAECAPTGCEGSMCSPNDEPAVCVTGVLAMCFAQLPASECGCVEGYCRWARTGPVNQCAVLGADSPTNRPVRGTDPAEMFPIRND